MRSRAGAVKRPRASSSRAVRTERRRGRGERTTRRTSTRDSHRASPAPSRSRARRRVRASFPLHIRMSSTARAYAGTTRGTSIRRARVVRRPSSSRRVAREKRKNGRSSRTSLAGLARSLVRSCARDDVRGNDRARRRVSSRRSRPVASLHFFIRARGYRVEACVKTMYVCEWFDTVKKRKKRRRRPVYVL